jgi:hypothetical protein
MNAQQGNIVAGLVALGLVTFVFVASEEMPDGPAGFPRLIAIGLLICSIILIGRAILSKKDSPILFTDIRWSTILLLAGVWIGVIFLVESLGFLIPGTFFVGLTAWFLLGRPTDGKTLARLVVFVIGVSLGLWVVFHKLLGVESPSGFFF